MAEQKTKGSGARYSFNCNHEKKNLEQYEPVFSLFEDKAKIALIWDFYVTHAPNIQKGKADEGQSNLRDFDYYGWRGNKLLELENELCRVGGFSMMPMIKSNSIKKTLAACDLDTIGCTYCPRMVLQQKHKAQSDEEEIVSLKSSETRMQCLFRHIRNALAHGGTHSYPNGTILLVDKDAKGASTAKIMLRKDTLIDWIWVIDKDGRSYSKSDFVFTD
jgi:hypothetical protein